MVSFTALCEYNKMIRRPMWQNLNFFKFFCQKSFRLIGPQTKQVNMYPWSVKIAIYSISVDLVFQSFQSFCLGKVLIYSHAWVHILDWRNTKVTTYVSKIETCLENSLFENDNIHLFIRKFTVLYRKSPQNSVQVQQRLYNLHTWTFLYKCTITFIRFRRNK